MPRVARIVVPGIPHHVTQRGNNQQSVFFTDDHRRLYLAFLQQYAEQWGMIVHAYCLMTNHVHLVATPKEPYSLARAVGRTNFRYSQALNKMKKWSGHLWQNRFASCALEDVHFHRAMRYVERNPVRAGLVRAPWRYPWSSAAAHVGGNDETGLLDMAQWRRQWKPQRWKDVLHDPDDEWRDLLCASTRTGRPLGDDRFVANLERRLKRQLRAMPVGRPKKKK